MRSFHILGTGAVGGYYGAKLQQAGYPVHFLLRSDYIHVREHGIKVISRDGDIVLPQVNAYARTSAMPPADIILVTLKATQNHLLGELLAPILTPQTTVVLLQNGIGEEDLVARIPGVTTVVAALAFICSTKSAPGLISHGDLGHIRFASFGGCVDIAESIAADFRNAGIDATAIDDLLLARWQKLAWNIPFSGLTVALNCNTKQLIESKAGERMVTDLITEVADCARACGKDITPAFQQRMIDMSRSMVPYAPSLKIDHDLGRPMEIEAIFGNPLRMALAAGYHPKRLEMLYNQLLFMQDHRQKRHEQR